MEEQVMDTPVEETQDTGDLYDIDAITDVFDEGSSEEPAEEIGTDEQNEPEPDAGEQQPVQEVEVSAIPQPEGWDESMWKGLSPEVQIHINERIQAHAQALAAQEKAQAELRAQHEQYTLKTNSEMQQALTTMKQVIEGEYGQINWQELANSDPATYVKLQQMYQQRMGAIQQIQRNITEQANQYRAAREQQAAVALDNEYKAVLPEIKAMMGSGFNGKNYAAEISNYMLSQGVPKEAINSVTNGYELKLATKAMLYDKILSQRSAAAQKVAQAPKVAAPTTGNVAEANQGKRSKALSALNRNPDSIDALTSLFENL